jgi:hypothetical protein
VISNKVTDHAEAAFRQSELGEALVGHIMHSGSLRTAERSDPRWPITAHRAFPPAQRARLANRPWVSTRPSARRAPLEVTVA